MKYPLSLLLTISALAQVPLAPTNLRVVAAEPTTYPVGSIIPVPVTPTNGQFVASWYSPPYIPRTNTVFVQPFATFWITEVSTDGVNWAGFRTECVYLPPREVRALSQPCPTCLHFTEVYNATDQVRIRLVSY
jgi:hypothetical protein